jgi:type I restriction enzyme S subunit
MSAWPIVPIKDYARVVGGATPKSGTSEYWDGDIPWTTPKDLSDLNGKYLADTPRKITALGLKSCASELLPPNSVLFSSRAPIGHVAINTVPMATNQGFKSFIPSPKLDASFLFWWLKCHRAQLELLGNGATFKEVSKAIVERIEIPLPPLDEQKRIAAILDQADELRRKRQRAIARLNQLGQAIFHEMFGDATTNPKGWPTKPLGELAANEDGKRIPVKMSDRANVEGVYPYYGASGIIDYVDGFIFDGERLLIGEDGANLLSRSSPLAFIARGKYWVNNHAHVLAFNGVANLRYLEFFIEAIDISRYVSGSAQPKITQKQLNSIEVPCPPMVIQERFSEIIEELESQKVQMAASYDLSNQMFSSLQNRAFQGEL